MTEITGKIVFISYSHDSPEHRQRVLALSERLRSGGIDTRLDAYVNGTPTAGWPRWVLDSLEEADAVLVVCTETYYRRFRGHEEPPAGKGADWEGMLITQELYESHSRGCKFVPVLFDSGDEAFIPEPLRSGTWYVLTSEAAYRELYDALLFQTGAEPGPLGTPDVRPRRTASPLTFDEPPAADADASPPPRVAPSRLSHGAARLFGRDDELARLDAAWDDAGCHLITVVAWGGAGKTALVAG